MCIRDSNIIIKSLNKKCFCDSLNLYCSFCCLINTTISNFIRTVSYRYTLYYPVYVFGCLMVIIYNGYHLTKFFPLISHVIENIDIMILSTSKLRITLECTYVLPKTFNRLKIKSLQCRKMSFTKDDCIKKLI